MTPRAFIIAVLLAQFTLVVKSAPPREYPPTSIDGSPKAVENVAVTANSNINNSTVTDKISAQNNSSNDLLDKSKLGFLVSCETNAATADKNLCSLYQDLAESLTKRKHDSITAEAINSMLAEQDAGEKDKFCENLTMVMRALNQKESRSDQVIRKALEDESKCTALCLPINNQMEQELKTICKVLLWGFRKQLLPEAGAPNASIKAAELVIPPLLPVDIEQKKTDSNGDNKSPVAVPVETTVAKNHTVAKEELHKDAQPEKAVDVVDKQPVSKTPTASTPLKEEDVLRTDDLNFPDGDDSLERLNDQTLKDNRKDQIEAGEALDSNSNEYEEQLPQTTEAPKDVPLIQHSGIQAKHDTDGTNLAEIQREEFKEDPFFEESDSNFFAYFFFMMFACIACYVAYHNKSKLLALALEGRRSSNGRSGFNKGRKHTAAYRKLDSNLEEAITSNTAASSRSTTQIIY